MRFENPTARSSCVSKILLERGSCGLNFYPQRSSCCLQDPRASDPQEAARSGRLAGAKRRSWTVDMEMEIKREWNGGVIFNHCTNNARGVAILINSRLDYTVTQTRGDNEGRVLNILLNLDGHVLNIINIYTPQTDSERRTFFSGLGNFISRSLIISLVVTTTVLKTQS